MSDLTRPAIEKIEELVEAKQQIVDVDGRQYSTNSLYEVTPPWPNSFEVMGLSGVSDFAKLHGEMHPDEVEKCIIYIKNWLNVALYGPPHPAWVKRPVLAYAQLEKNFEDVGHAMGQWMDQSSFMIFLQTWFERDEGDIANLLQLVSSIRSENSVREDDDGIAQEVAVRKGASLKAMASVKNPFTLHPYRTFREITQPAGTYILRLRGGGDQGKLNLALFEQSSGGWKLHAMEAIKEWFVGDLPGWTIIG